MCDGPFDGVNWYLTYCEKCNQIIKRERERAEKETERRAAQEEREREIEYAKQAELAKKKARKKKKYQENILASGGRLCVACGSHIVASTSSLCMSCKSSAHDWFQKNPHMRTP